MEDAVIVSACGRRWAASAGSSRTSRPPSSAHTRCAPRSSGRGSPARRSTRCCSAACSRPGSDRTPPAKSRSRPGSQGGPRDDDQHGLRVGPQGGRDRIADDPRGRRRHRGGGRHGEHDARSVPAAVRALRRADGRRAADRLDGPRRLWDAFNDIQWASPPRTSPTSTASAATNRTSSPPAASRRPSSDRQRDLRGRDRPDRGAGKGRQPHGGHRRASPGGHDR